jgi:hypothetical protein
MIDIAFPYGSVQWLMFSAEGVQSSSGLRRLLPTSGKDALLEKVGDNFAGNRKEKKRGEEVCEFV